MRAATATSTVIVVLLALTLQSCASAPARRGRSNAFMATAYCDRGITKSGMRTREGFLAADPAQLPIGSVVRITSAGDRRYERVYTVMDTGGHVQGRRIDLYMHSCDEAKRFGVRQVSLEVVRLGWKSDSSSR